MLGDTIYDARACVAAGVACIGVRSGGNDSVALEGAGARVVLEDLADVLANLTGTLDSL
jgi:phosphoglycolate phosphatase-like HAD superfamily hydrolase